MLRVYLSGQVAIETPEGRATAVHFPGRQGREAFSLLVMRRGMPVSRSELADALWKRSPPAAADSALNSIVSKLRRLLSGLGVDGPSTLRSAAGYYELQLHPTSQRWWDT